MDPPDLASIELPVAPIRPEELGTSAAWLSRRGFDLLGVEEGEPVEIEGDGRLLWLRCLAAHPDDEGIDVVRVDPADLERLDVEAGEKVQIRAGRVQPARSVELAIGGNASLAKDEFREALGGGAILPGELIRVPVDEESGRFDAGLNVVGIQLLGISGWRGRTEEIRIRVLSTSPDGPVRITPSTEIHVHPPGRE